MQIYDNGGKRTCAERKLRGYISCWCGDDGQLLSEDNASRIKKLSACRRDSYKVDEQTNGATITFRTAAFEAFGQNILQILENSSLNCKVDINVLKDLKGNITQEIIRVKDKESPNGARFTINAYMVTLRWP